MNKNNTSLVPKIRFPEFTDDWEQRKFGEILDEFSNKSKTENEYPVLSSTNTGMEFRDGRVSGTSNVGYKIINNNDLVLSPQNLWLGNININDIGTGIVSPSYKTFKLKDIETDFFRPQIRTQYLMNEYYNASIQGASVVRRNLDNEKFNAISIYVPSSSEQVAIGCFFRNLDNLITLHQRKLLTTKKLKKAMLQKMFPKNGCKVPEVRFKGFTDDWEQRKLSEVATFIRGSFPQPYTNPDYYDENNGKPFVQVGDIGMDLLLNEDTKAHISSIAESKSRFVKAGTVIVALQGSIEKSIGRTAITQYDAFVDRTILIFENYKIPIDKLFFAQTIKALFEIEKEKAWGATISTITKDYLSDFVIGVPSIDEQKKIGAFFKQLDNLITLHQRKLDLYKKLKKGMLQKMFV